jgi:hypothetical protein
LTAKMMSREMSAVEGMGRVVMMAVRSSTSTDRGSRWQGQVRGATGVQSSRLPSVAGQGSRGQKPSKHQHKQVWQDLGRQPRPARWQPQAPRGSSNLSHYLHPILSSQPLTRSWVTTFSFQQQVEAGMEMGTGVRISWLC